MKICFKSAAAETAALLVEVGGCQTVTRKAIA